MYVYFSLAEYRNRYDRYQLPNEGRGSDGNSSGIVGTIGGSVASTSTPKDFNSDLDAALKLSLECFNDTEQQLGESSSSSERLSQIQLRDKRLAYFSAMSSNDK